MQKITPKQQTAICARLTAAKRFGTRKASGRRLDTQMGLSEASVAKLTSTMAAHAEPGGDQVYHAPLLENAAEWAETTVAELKSTRGVPAVLIHPDSLPPRPKNVPASLKLLDKIYADNGRDRDKMTPDGMTEGDG